MKGQLDNKSHGKTLRMTMRVFKNPMPLPPKTLVEIHGAFPMGNKNTM